MACIKKLHDKLGKVGKVNSKFVKFANFAMQIFLCSLRPDHFKFWGRAEAQVARQFSGAVLTFATLLPNAIL